MGVAGGLGRVTIRKAMEPPIRLMIVDDSSVARAVLSRIIETYDGFEIAALAGSAAEALAALQSIQVDIVLLDLEMPGISGLQALPEILAAGEGARVLVVSSHAAAGAEATVQALALGAADTLPKPNASGLAGRFADMLADRLRLIGRVRREPVPTRREPMPRFDLRPMPEGPIGCVAIGASTGGLPALNQFLAAWPRGTGAPILVTQHLPPAFIPVFARQLEAGSGRQAVVVADGQPLAADRIHVAPGDAHLRVEVQGQLVVARLSREPASSGCLPSVDPMLASVGALFRATAVGVVLSGMGKDGLDGAGTLVERGGAILAQDRPSSSVWGMPRAVAEAGLASAVLSPVELARRLTARLEANAR
jgi:two-component system chemotaxis response regulator CheB